jgi:hypothetical protein
VKYLWKEDLIDRFARLKKKVITSDNGFLRSPYLIGDDLGDDTSGRPWVMCK